MINHLFIYLIYNILCKSSSYNTIYNMRYCLCCTTSVSERYLSEITCTFYTTLHPYIFEYFYWAHSPADDTMLCTTQQSMYTRYSLLVLLLHVFSCDALQCFLNKRKIQHAMGRTLLSCRSRFSSCKLYPPFQGCLRLTASLW